MTALAGVVGRVARDPELRPGRKGPFCLTALVTLTDSGGTELVEMAAFGRTAGPLSRLRRGETVVAVGHLEPHVWSGPDGAERSRERLRVVAFGRAVAPDPKTIHETRPHAREGGVHG